MNIIEFINKYSPCSEAKLWLIDLNEKGKTMGQAWNICKKGEWMLWAHEKIRKNDVKERALVSCALARRTLNLFEKEYPKDMRPRMAIEKTEEWAKDPTDKREAAWAVTRDAARAEGDAESKWQANYIRKNMVNPFLKGTKK